jgi:hypothetical protein
MRYFGGSESHLTNKLLIDSQGGESCISSAAKMVLNDFQRGKLPYFVKPPGCENEENKEEEDKKATELIENLQSLDVEPVAEKAVEEEPVTKKKILKKKEVVEVKKKIEKKKKVKRNNS